MFPNTNTYVGAYVRTRDERDVVGGPVRRGAHVSCTSRTPLQHCAYERTLLPHHPPARSLTHSLIHTSTPVVVVVVVCGAETAAVLDLQAGQ